MEPERKIETWLRAYAKKRRGQAGDSFKLDPATRRILQNEISGMAPSSEEEDESMSLWEVLQRHWAFFLGFAVCVFILASIFFQTGSMLKKKALLSMSSQSAHTENLRQIAGAVNSNPPQIASKMPKQMLPQISEATARPETLEASRRFQALQNSFVNTITSASQSSPVLVNFRVEQAGSIIRVLDQDGSVYSGTMYSNGKAATASAAAQNATTLMGAGPRSVESDKVGPAPSAVVEQQPATSHRRLYSFRVDGMNRTLNQPVLLKATLIENLDAMKSGQTNQPGQLLWSNVRITGVAIINRTNQIQINATPVPVSSNAASPNN